MRILRTVFMCIFFVIAGLTVFAQNASHGSADIVILIDTSGTVLQYYEEINKRILNEITNKFIRKGDTVHILSFNADARYEMSQKINSEADLLRVVSRFFLLYQLGQNSDFLTGLSYCKQYTSNLPAAQEQILIVISDGIFNPPASSPYKNYSGEQIKNEISLLAGSIRRNGWKVYYVKLPYPSDAVIRDLDGEEFYNSASSAAAAKALNGGSGGAPHGTDNSGSEKDTENKSSSAANNANGVNGTGNAGNGSADASNANSAQSTTGDNTSGKGSGDDSSGNSNLTGTGNGNTKNYTDVSKPFTKSVGASTSELSEKGAFSITDNGKNLPQIVFPDELKSYGNNLRFPIEVINTSDEDIELRLTEIVLDNGIDLNKISAEDSEKIYVKTGEKTVITVKIKLPQEYSEGNYTVRMRLEFEDGIAVLPQTAELRLSVFPAGLKRFFGSNLLLFVILALALLLLAGLILFFIFRRRTSDPVSGALRRADDSANTAYNEKELDNARQLNTFNQNNGTQQDGASRSSIYSENNKDRIASQTREDRALRKSVLAASLSAQQPRGAHISPANHLEKIEIKSSQSGMTEIYVLTQNRNIGKRNIHVMKPGTRLSVGGGKADDFLIFLVPFPSHLAQVRYDGKDYHLAILKPEYFPYEKSNVINNCIGKTVTAVSDKGYHVYFTFRGYEDPAVKLNSLLTSIKYE